MGEHSCVALRGSPYTSLNWYIYFHIISLQRRQGWKISITAMSIMGAGLHGSCKFKAYHSADTKCMLCAKNKLVKNARRRRYFKLPFADKTMEGIPSYFISSI